MNVKPQRWGIVVDDQLKQAEGIVKVLNQAGLPSKAFRDPDEALRFAEQHRGSVVFAIFDVYMGEKSGADYARIFRERNLSNDIFLLTGYTDVIPPEVKQELQRLGIPIYEKPIDLDSLIKEKLNVWRSMTPEEIAQPSPTPVIRTFGDIGSDKGTAEADTASSREEKDSNAEELRLGLARVEGILEGSDRQKGLKLAWWQNAWAVVGIIIAILIAVATSNRCSSPEPPIPKGPDKQTPILTKRVVIAEGTQPVAGPVYVAYEKQFWKELGLDVELVAFTSGRACLDAVLAGKADVGTMAETPIMNAGFNGSPMYVVAGIHKSGRNTKVVARKDRGVSKPSDLKGHKVGVSVGTNGEFFMDQFLKREGLTRKDVQVVNLRPEEMTASLASGKVDACFTWEPHVQNARIQLGDRAVVFDNNGIYTETYNIVTTQGFAKSEPKELELLLKGLDKAVAYMRENPDDSIGIVSRRIGLDAGVLKAIWGDYTFQLSLESSFLDLLNEEAEWAKVSGGVPHAAETPNYRLYLLTDPLKAVRPEAVTIK